MAGKGKERRPRRTREEWAALISEQAESGLSQRAFCESRDLSISTFSNAKRRARTAPGDDEAQRAGEFVPVIVDAETTQATARRWDIELALGPRVVLRIRGV